MKFALVDGHRQEAQPKLVGNCQTCGSPMVAKCGEQRLRVWHWAHKAGRSCDPWWEKETEWHRAWKNRFPVEWQEVIHQADSGEKHIADIKTEQGRVIEFQHSPIKSYERRSREDFYQKMVWVVDGTRRKNDPKQFVNAWNSGLLVARNAPIRMVMTEKCVLLREWADSRVPVFFDFGGDQMLCWLLSSRPGGRAYVVFYQFAEFIGIHLGKATEAANDFDMFIADIQKLVNDFEKAQTSRRTPQQPQSGFQQYLTRRERYRRRF